MCNSSSHCAGGQGDGREEGSAVLLLMTLLLILLSGTLLDGWLAQRSRATAWLEDAKVLGTAREALLAYGTVRARQGGGLPCPDGGTTEEGQAAMVCSSPEGLSVGRLPWRTLGLTPLRTGDGEGVWYAVATPFLQSPVEKKSSSAAWLELEQGRGPWAAVLFVPRERLRAGEPVVLSSVLRDAQWLPVTVDDLSAIFGGKHHDSAR
ncbi:MAG: hypothetical protein H7836_04990 [Magnetococcus sp. YQC-3]